MKVVFSTFALHDYFRWSKVRGRLVADAQRRGIALSEVKGGCEVNRWNDVEKNWAFAIWRPAGILVFQATPHRTPAARRRPVDHVPSDQSLAFAFSGSEVGRTTMMVSGPPVPPRIGYILSRTAAAA